MSLNQVEQTVHDHIMRHPEERGHWQEKVTRLVAGAADDHAVATALAAELVAFCRERAGVLPLFQTLVGPGTPTRLTLRSLAELFVRRWGPPRGPKRPPAAIPPDGPGRSA
jgi:hypothetical protein